MATSKPSLTNCPIGFRIDAKVAYTVSFIEQKGENGKVKSVIKREQSDLFELPSVNRLKTTQVGLKLPFNVKKTLLL